MRVEWTELAEAHLESIYEFLARASERFAEEMVDRITARTVQIADFPESGRLVARAEPLGLREIFEGSYRIIYVVAHDHIEVLGVIHGRRDLL